MGWVKEKAFLLILTKKAKLQGRGMENLRLSHRPALPCPDVDARTDDAIITP
jgi:hypothetical protein